MTVTLPGQETGLLPWHFLIRYWFVAIAISCFRQWHYLVKDWFIEDRDWFVTVAFPGQILVCARGIAWSETGL